MCKLEKNKGQGRIENHFQMTIWVKDMEVKHFGNGKLIPKRMKGIQLTYFKSQHGCLPPTCKISLSGVVLINPKSTRHCALVEVEALGVQFCNHKERRLVIVQISTYYDSWLSYSSCLFASLTDVIPSFGLIYI